MTTHPPTQIGRYLIERELGRGTMGVVYEARDTTLGRTVALKTFGAMAAIAPHEREAFEARFLSEARISATLDDENVVGVYDVGRDFETGLLFMALEFVRGQTLSEALSRGPMPWEEAARIVAKVARALQTAHANHIVHRDIKPANIMLTTAGEPKIMDFGIAKASAAQLTVAGQVFGTPAYMSPEQASGEEVDGRSDVFSLGCVLYELVTNTRPFEGNTMAATLTKILRDEPRPASSMARIPRGLDAVIARSLRKERGKRYDSAAHMVEDLERLLQGEAPIYATQAGPLDTLDLVKPVSAPWKAPASRPTDAPKSPATSPPEELLIVDEPPTKVPVPFIAAGALILVLGAAVYLLRPAAVVSPAPEAVASPPASAVVPAAPTPAPEGLVGVPVQGPAALPTTTNLSADAGAAPGKVTLDLRHPFASASLRIKVGERVVFVSRIGGMPIRNAGVTTGYDGRFGTDLVIPAGEHTVQVELRASGAELIQSIPVRVRSGEIRRLTARADKTLILTFE